MRFKILNSKEKRKLEEKTGKKIEEILIESNGKIRIYTGNLSRRELEEFFNNINVLRIGLNIDY